MKKFKVILSIILVMILMSIICSCRTQYVPVETIRTEYKDRIIRDSSRSKEVMNSRDSIRYRDSIVQVLDADGNVLRTEVYKWRDRFRENSYLLKQLQSKYDSLYIAKQDSVQVPYPVEKQLSKWQQLKIELGGWAFGLIISLTVVIIGRFIYSKRKN